GTTGQSRAHPPGRPPRVGRRRPDPGRGGRGRRPPRRRSNPDRTGTALPVGPLFTRRPPAQRGEPELRTRPVLLPCQRTQPPGPRPRSRTSRTVESRLARPALLPNRTP